MGDSQVSSGWLGKAYNVYNNIEKEEKAEMEKKDFEAELDGLVSDVIGDLEGQLGSSIDDTDAGDEYKAHCYKAFKQYGHQVYGFLSCLENFTSWVEKKEEKKAGGAQVVMLMVMMMVMMMMTMMKLVMVMLMMMMVMMIMGDDENEDEDHED